MTKPFDEDSLRRDDGVDGRETAEMPAAPPARAWFLEVQHEERTRRVPVPEGGIVLGSARGTSVLLEDRHVSARHSVFFVRGDRLYVEDLGSRNGTYVGGARIERAWTTEGATVSIGQATVVCTAESVWAGEDELEELGEPLPGMAGGSVAMRRVSAAVRRLARLTAPVLVTGESGVGKELIARALHHEGHRRTSPFVAMNVASLPRELVESELFGHERGAFTGAVVRRVGAFAEAEAGTLFLDEIGELPIDAQPKLLRALDGYEVRRIGSGGSGRRVDARIVAATHVPLLERVERGAFRRDLYHRLEVFVVEVPALRERPGDIPPIARAILDVLAPEVGPRELSPGAVAQLAAHPWLGNVRELRNVLHRASDLARDARVLDAVAIQRAFRSGPGSSNGAPAGMSFTPGLAHAWLRRYQGNVSAAARAAGLPRTTFRKLLGATFADGSDRIAGRDAPLALEADPPPSEA